MAGFRRALLSAYLFCQTHHFFLCNVLILPIMPLFLATAGPGAGTGTGTGTYFRARSDVVLNNILKQVLGARNILVSYLLRDQTKVLYPPGHNFSQNALFTYRPLLCSISVDTLSHRLRVLRDLQILFMLLILSPIWSTAWTYIPNSTW